ncbi:MAG TPA: hypothetical protein PLS03_07865 [Terrimicrobiaceae bacterium]|nr:hypothetical protein [Terrimicrobiaceae bacterium]
MAIRRVLTPEILDHLDFRDPEAARSRADLRRINALMGNERWVRRTLTGKPLDRGIVEIGAGEGRLCRVLARGFRGIPLLGMDRLPRPPGLPDDISWIRGDLLAALPAVRAGVLVGVMILHHFSDTELAEIGRCLGGIGGLCFCEPWRSEWSLALSRGMAPFTGSVTRHDMPASIRAGFVPGELPALLGLKGWKITESRDWRGALRFQAWRK